MSTPSSTVSTTTEAVNSASTANVVVAAMTLIVFWSRSGSTKILAQKLAASIPNSELLEIKSVEDFSGIWGSLMIAKHWFYSDGSKLSEESSKAIEGFETKFTSVWIGTPIFMGSVSPPMRTWLTQHKAQLVDEQGKPKVRLGLFASMGGSGDAATFAEMRRRLNVTDTAIIQTLAVNEKQLASFDGSTAPKLEL